LLFFLNKLFYIKFVFILLNHFNDGPFTLIYIILAAIIAYSACPNPSISGNIPPILQKISYNHLTNLNSDEHNCRSHHLRIPFNLADLTTS
jgi:hypothetical protein